MRFRDDGPCACELNSFHWKCHSPRPPPKERPSVPASFDSQPLLEKLSLSFSFPLALCGCLCPRDSRSCIFGTTWPSSKEKPQECFSEALPNLDKTLGSPSSNNNIAREAWGIPTRGTLVYGLQIGSCNFPIATVLKRWWLARSGS